MDKKKIVIIVLLTLIIAIIVYYYAYVQEKKYLNEVSEQGIIFKSDSNIQELLVKYQDNNDWTFFADISEQKKNGPEYGCSILYSMVLSGNDKNILSLYKVTEQEVTFCTGYDSKIKQYVSYNLENCETQKTNNFLVEYNSNNDKDEIILYDNKVVIFTTKDNGYNTCKYFLDLFFDTDALGDAVKAKIDQSNLNINSYVPK
ncbi:MAG: hypothetical protein COT55_01155 [Candidatus Diapherotrites archaeon CG09_land_8_20_14_0_10_32_12]|nr:MAG: hypothetical protein COT55_01155 [Candidatus Diapherotrites archaeon CG09_land_8_20_14_0_10_32_12]